MLRKEPHLGSDDMKKANSAEVRLLFLEKPSCKVGPWLKSGNLTYLCSLSDHEWLIVLIVLIQMVWFVPNT